MMDSILLLALIWFVVLPIAVIVWAYFAGERIERREEAERAIRLAELARARPVRAPQGAVEPAKPTYLADRELEVPSDAATRLP